MNKICWTIIIRLAIVLIGCYVASALFQSGFVLFALITYIVTGSFIIHVSVELIETFKIKLTKTNKTNKMNIKPLHDRIVIESIKLDNLTPGGIIMPGTENKPSNKGVVKAVGSGKTDQPMTLKVGDNVIHMYGAGLPITDTDGTDYLIMRETDVLAILN